MGCVLHTMCSQRRKKFSWENEKKINCDYRHFFSSCSSDGWMADDESPSSSSPDDCDAPDVVVVSFFSFSWFFLFSISLSVWIVGLKGGEEEDATQTHNLKSSRFIRIKSRSETIVVVYYRLSSCTNQHIPLSSLVCFSFEDGRHEYSRTRRSLNLLLMLLMDRVWNWYSTVENSDDVHPDDDDDDDGATTPALLIDLPPTAGFLFFRTQEWNERERQELEDEAREKEKRSLAAYCIRRKGVLERKTSAYGDPPLLFSYSYSFSLPLYSFSGESKQWEEGYNFSFTLPQYIFEKRTWSHCIWYSLTTHILFSHISLLCLPWTLAFFWSSFSLSPFL